LRQKYGISEQQYLELYERQKGCCAVCKKSLVSQLDSTRPFAKGVAEENLGRVDHCHKTGRIRGLLCFNCNIALGKLQDDEQILLNAVRYLRESATATGFDRPQHDTL
jgi:hypothetical protein